MEQYVLQAYEALGHWTITMSVRWDDGEGRTEHGVLYRGDHVPIDEEDPQVRAMLLLSQVHSDLNWAYQHESDTQGSRGMGH